MKEINKIKVTFKDGKKISFTSNFDTYHLLRLLNPSHSIKHAIFQDVKTKETILITMSEVKYIKTKEKKWKTK